MTPLIGRRFFLGSVFAGLGTATSWRASNAAENELQPGITIGVVGPDEDLFAYIQRMSGQFDERLYKRLLGAANEFKEGDAIVGVSAADESSRAAARKLLANTRLESIDTHPPYRDNLYRFLQARHRARRAGLVLAVDARPVERTSAHRHRSRDQAPHAWPLQRCDRLPGKTHVQPRVDRARCQNLQSTTRQ